MKTEIYNDGKNTLVRSHIEYAGSTYWLNGNLIKGYDDESALEQMHKLIGY